MKNAIKNLNPGKYMTLKYHHLHPQILLMVTLAWCKCGILLPYLLPVELKVCRALILWWPVLGITGTLPKLQKNTLFIHHTIHQTLLKWPVNDNDAHFLPAPQVHFLIAVSSWPRPIKSLHRHFHLQREEKNCWTQAKKKVVFGVLLKCIDLVQKPFHSISVDG